MDQRPDVVGIVRRRDIGLLDVPVDVGGSSDAVDVGSQQGKEPGKEGVLRTVFLAGISRAATYTTMLVTLITIPSVAAIVQDGFFRDVGLKQE